MRGIWGTQIQWKNSQFPHPGRRARSFAGSGDAEVLARATWTISASGARLPTQAGIARRMTCVCGLGIRQAVLAHSGNVPFDLLRAGTCLV